MKLFRPIGLLALFLLSVIGSSHAQSRGSHPPIPTPRGAFPVNPVEMNESRSTNTVLKEDFQSVNIPSLPAGWTSLSPEGDFTTGDADDANAGGYFPVPDIAGNVFAMANDDVCNCDMSNIRLISPMFDLSGLSNMVLRFNAYHDKNWGGGDATAQISTDGGTSWDTLKVLNSATNWQYYVLDLSAYTGNSNVKVKFQWSDGGTWASGFAVDNIVVDELLANDLRVEKVWTSEMKMDLEYSMLPLSQRQGSGMTIGARVKNNGSDLQSNTRVAGRISRNGTLLFSDTSNASDLDSMQRDPYWIPASFVPDSTGMHAVEMEAFSDQSEAYPADNVMQDSVRFTCDRFARDRGDYDGNSLGASPYSNGKEQGFQAGNLFRMRSDAEIRALRFLADTSSEAGAKFRGSLYKLDTANNSFDTLARTPLDTLQSGDIASVSNEVWTDASFDSMVTLDSGAYYLGAIVVTDSSAEKIEVGVSGISPHQTSYFSLDSSANWTDVNATPMVRLISAPFTIPLPEDSTVCNDSSLTLDAGPGDAYMWNTGDQSQSIQVSTPGTYSVNVTRGQCQYEDSIRIDTASFRLDLPEDTSVCEDSTVTLDAGPADSYMWSTGDQTRTIEVGGPSSYWISATRSGCEDIDTVMVDTIQGCATGIRTHASKTPLRLRPNPARESLYLEGIDGIKVESVRIIDLQGRPVKEFGADRRELSISELPEGSYILRVRSEDKLRVKRFIVE